MAAQQAPAFEKGKLYNLPIIDIKPDPDQPRKYTVGGPVDVLVITPDSFSQEQR
jgi:hypothetical protein